MRLPRSLFGFGICLVVAGNTVAPTSAAPPMSWSSNCPSCTTFPGSAPVVSTPVRGSAHFPAGTSRAQVIQQLGQPSVTIVTFDGEMLGFTNGAMIYLQNGLVVIR